jgi:hypothetical protein
VSVIRFHERDFMIGFVPLLANVVNPATSVGRDIAFLSKVVDIVEEALAFRRALFNGNVHKKLSTS